MAMTGRTNSDTGIAVEKYIAVDVFHPNSLGALRDEFESGPRIRRCNELRVGSDDFLALWTRQCGLDNWTLRRRHGAG
jgi:hypothetical protein